MQFEYDSSKSALSLEKHGIDFELAKTLWNDPWMIEVPARTADEARFLVIGRIEGRHWAAIWTPRGTAIRIISVRRARKEEVRYYEGD